MYISGIPLICHHSQLISCLKLRLSPWDHLSAFPLQSYQKAVIRPCDLHDSPAFEHRSSHNDKLAQHFLLPAGALFPLWDPLPGSILLSRLS